MKRSPKPSGATKWCHVVCTTHRRRQLFKIPAHARFCERYVRDVCNLPGWTVDAVAVLPDRIQLLLCVPTTLTRGEVAAWVEQAATEVVHHAGMRRMWHLRLWRVPTWCAMLTNGVAVSRVRAHITARSLSRPREALRTADPLGALTLFLQ